MVRLQWTIAEARMRALEAAVIGGCANDYRKTQELNRLFGSGRRPAAVAGRCSRWAAARGVEAAQARRPWHQRGSGQGGQTALAGRAVSMSALVASRILAWWSTEPRESQPPGGTRSAAWGRIADPRAASQGTTYPDKS